MRCLLPTDWGGLLEQHRSVLRRSLCRLPQVLEGEATRLYYAYTALVDINVIHNLRLLLLGTRGELYTKGRTSGMYCARK